MFGYDILKSNRDCLVAFCYNEQENRICYMTKQDKQNRVKNGIFTAAIGLIVLVAFLLRMTQKGDSPELLEIVQRGTVIETYPLAEDQTIRITDTEGHYNIVEISQGVVRVTEADCSNQDCVRQGGISKSGESIICLPHQLVIRIKGAAQEYDAVSW